MFAVGRSNVSIKRYRKQVPLLLAPIILGTMITIILSVNLRNALPDTSFSIQTSANALENGTVSCTECLEKVAILSRRKRLGDTLKWFWDTRARPALKTTLKSALRSAGHTQANADMTVEWAADQLHYIGKTRKYRLLARFVERRIAFVLTNLPILLRDGINSKCFIPL